MFLNEKPQVIGIIDKSIVAFLKASLISSSVIKSGSSKNFFAESESNQIESLNDFGISEIGMGVESGFDQLVHLTNPKGKDLSSVASSNQNVVVCPRANAALNVGVAPLNKMLELGIKPLLGSDNVMLNSPNMLRELEFSLKIMAVCYKRYINPVDLVKMATTNICESNINCIVKKAVILENNFAEFIIVKSFSKNPYLNICNRLETKDILSIINKRINI